MPSLLEAPGSQIWQQRNQNREEGAIGKIKANMAQNRKGQFWLCWLCWRSYAKSCISGHKFQYNLFCRLILLCFLLSPSLRLGFRFHPHELVDVGVFFYKRKVVIPAAVSRLLSSLSCFASLLLFSFPAILSRPPKRGRPIGKDSLTNGAERIPHRGGADFGCSSHVRPVFVPRCAFSFALSSSRSLS